VSKKIMIITETVQMEAELNDSKTAALIWEALPINAEVSTWGDEIYFTIPVDRQIKKQIDCTSQYN
jgi:uncharacterized protein